MYYILYLFNDCIYLKSILISCECISKHYFILFLVATGVRCERFVVGAAKKALEETGVVLHCVDRVAQGIFLPSPPPTTSCSWNWMQKHIMCIMCFCFALRWFFSSPCNCSVFFWFCIWVCWCCFVSYGYGYVPLLAGWQPSWRCKTGYWKCRGSWKSLGSACMRRCLRLIGHTCGRGKIIWWGRKNSW